MEARHSLAGTELTYVFAAQRMRRGRDGPGWFRSWIRAGDIGMECRSRIKVVEIHEESKRLHEILVVTRAEKG